MYVRKWWVVPSAVSPEIRVGMVIPECSVHLCWVFPSLAWEVSLPHSGSTDHGTGSGSCGIIKKPGLVYCPDIRCCKPETQVYPTGTLRQPWLHDLPYYHFPISWLSYLPTMYLHFSTPVSSQINRSPLGTFYPVVTVLLHPDLNLIFVVGWPWPDARCPPKPLYHSPSTTGHGEKIKRKARRSR